MTGPGRRATQKYRKLIVVREENFKKCDKFLDSYRIIAMHIQKGLERSAKLIVVDPEQTEMAQKVDLFLQIPPGYNIPTLNCIMTVIGEVLCNKEFLETFTTGFEYLKMAVEPYAPKVVGKRTGVEPELFVKAAREPHGLFAPYPDLDYPGTSYLYCQWSRKIEPFMVIKNEPHRFILKISFVLFC